MTRGYQVWCESGDFISEFTNPREAEQRLEQELAEHIATSVCAGVACGVLHEETHGYFIQAVEDGRDVTQDYLINGY